MCQNLFNLSPTLGYLGCFQYFIALGEVATIFSFTNFSFASPHFYKINPQKCNYECKTDTSKITSTQMSPSSLKLCLILGSY